MDFAKLDLREATEAEYWLHLRIGETPLYVNMDAQKEEERCRVKVASPANPDVDAALKAVKRAGEREQALSGRLSVANREDRRSLESQIKAAEAEAEKALQTFLTTAIKGWENLTSETENGKSKAVPFSAEKLSDWSQKLAPIGRLATYIIEDMASTADPFSNPDSA